MTAFTLLTKIYNSHQLKQMDEILSDLIEGLDVQVGITGTLANKWVQIDVTGEDEAVAAKLLKRDIGFCPIELENVKKFDALKGYVTNIEKSRDALMIDIGVAQPNTINASIPLTHLQATLTNGKKHSLKRISELWGFSDNLPLNIKILKINTEENAIEAELHDSQVRRLELWKASLLDRLLVTGASPKEVNTAIDQAGIRRDVIDIEALGPFENAMVCKLGTDAAGLIGSIGRRLRKAKFTVFNPKKLFEV